MSNTLGITDLMIVGFFTTSCRFFPPQHLKKKVKEKSRIAPASKPAEKLYGNIHDCSFIHDL